MEPDLNDLTKRDLQNKHSLLGLIIKANQQAHPDLWNKLEESQLTGILMIGRRNH